MIYPVPPRAPISNPTLFRTATSSTTMKTAQHHPHHHQKQPPKQIKPPNRSPSIFSCTFFRHCTDSPVSPTLPQPSPPPPPPSLPPLPPPASRQLGSLPPPHHPTKPSDSESSSSSTSQSFTQWRFPPTFPHPPLDPSPPRPPSLPPPPPTPPPPPPIPLPPSDLRELFHVAELKFTAGSDSDRLSALHMMERSLVPNPPSDAASAGSDGGGAVVVPAVVMSGVVGYMKEKTAAKSATKILLALCLSEGNRRAAVECGAAARVVDALPDLEGTVAERALAALELMCTVPEGAAEVRAHALAVPMLVAVMGRMEGRGREYAIGVLAAFYGNGADHELVAAAAPPEEVARAVVLAMQQGDCSARGKRKGAQLLKALQENGGLDLSPEA